MGEWMTNEISYIRANREACHLCGHPIARRYWGALVDGTPQKFCSPEHERLYHDYLLVRHPRPVEV